MLPNVYNNFKRIVQTLCLLSLLSVPALAQDAVADAAMAGHVPPVPRLAESSAGDSSKDTPVHDPAQAIADLSEQIHAQCSQ